MIPLSAIFILRNFRVHVSAINGSNVMFKIKGPINKKFSFETVLRVLDVNPNNSHIRVGKNFDNS